MFCQLIRPFQGNLQNMNPVHCAQVSYYIYVSVTANLHVYGFLLMKKCFVNCFVN